MYDILIREGLVIDGSGGEPFISDIAIKDGIIQGFEDGPAEQTIDAKGLVVTPGFVDMHTHYDGQVTWENRLHPSTQHGVTTVLMGNCGVGFAPARLDQHELVIKLMEGVEDIPEVVMEAGVPWGWETFPQYLDALENRACDADFATQIPHSPLRVFVMGERGANLEPPTQEDLDTMRRLTCEAMKAGALGVSTSRNFGHRFKDGRLAPSVATEEDELSALALGLRDAGAGVFQLNPDYDRPIDEEIGLMRRLTEISGRPTSFSLIARPNTEASWDALVACVREAEEEALPLRAQFYPRPNGMLIGLDLSLHPFRLHPSYRRIADLPLGEKVAAMRDPAFRAQILSEQPEDPNPALLRLVRVHDHLYRLGDPPNYKPDPSESLVAQARQQGIAPQELIYDALLEKDGRAILYSISIDAPAYIDRSLELYGEANALMGLGDGGAHYGMICDAAYPTFVLTEIVRNSGLSLPLAITELTRRPAEAIGLRDRGRIAAGYRADINVIDLDHLALHAPEVKRDLPSGGKRLHQKATGFRYTMVNGKITYVDGEATGALPGRLVRGTRGKPG